MPSAESELKSIGYYRLSGYLYPFLQQPKEAHRYKEGSTLGSALNLYEFDRQLRLIVFDQIERVEIAVRSAIVDITCSETGDVFWITNEKWYAKTEKYGKTQTLIEKELRKTHEEFIYHFKQVYDNPYPPAWMIAGILPLGVLTQVYENIASNKIRKKIAARFSLNIPVFSSWLTILTVTRNTSGHHARLWNRSLTLRALKMRHPSTPWVPDAASQGRVFFTLCILKHYVDIIRPTNTFKKDLTGLIKQYKTIDTSVMGFPESWQEEPLWS